MAQFKLLTLPDHQPKTKKGIKRGVMTFALHLAPADLSGFEVCPRRSEGCSAACLNTAGRGVFSGVQLARIARTQMYFQDRPRFLALLQKELSAAIRYAAKRGYRAAFRLNATSDIPWHRVPVAGAANVMAAYPDAQFYDYTKVAKRFAEALPANYDLTFSLSEENEHEAREVLAAGGRVAVVFRDKATVARVQESGFLGTPAIGGDDDDLRFLEPGGVVVALYAKGRARADASGFVRDLAATEAA
jgi:hypothetical protein